MLKNYFLSNKYLTLNPSALSTLVFYRVITPNFPSSVMNNKIRFDKKLNDSKILQFKITIKLLLVNSSCLIRTYLLTIFKGISKI